MIALSYSRLSTYQQCPFKFKSQFLDKTYPDDSDNIYFIKGQKKHKQVENYIKCKLDPTMVPMRYDGDVKSVLPIIDGLFNCGFNVNAELKLALDKDLNATTWFSKKAAWRAICDIIAIKGDEAIVCDIKTGKYRDYDSKPEGQLHLSSMIIFATYPEVTYIKTSYLYIEHKQSVIRQFTRDMDLYSPFSDLFDRVNSDNEFKPIKNMFCNWCLLGKEGECPL